MFYSRQQSLYLNLSALYTSATVLSSNNSWFFLFQAERYVDRKLDQAESSMKKNQQKAKKWYSSLIGDETGPKINNLHVFLFAFTGGVAIGLVSAK